ncbi:3-oxoadipate enol-lactone hydrolase-like protein [Amylocarpus encephaloides]|uniref:3-oxoadipate enol-lactone hydrolase-like protein n=1 Tax=Amylocarpus encephaloides TaxID=45428 RepID=A0A9P7YMY0_9HELO|nr:3-oxoadipate enol-lactone hydrolase-like protein [Amylocarpus encephaloides]
MVANESGHTRSLFFSDDKQTEGPRAVTVFLHGLGSSSCFYQTIIPSLTKFTRCLAIDSPGSGLSEIDEGSSSLLDTISQSISSVLKHLDIQDQVVVVGHSMGCIVATSFAARNPHLVKAVVLLGPVDPSPSLEDVFRKRIAVVEKDGLEPLANSIPTAATGSKAGSLQHAFIRSLILGTSTQGYIQLCDAIATAKSPLYSSINVPLLIIAGMEDKTAPMLGCQNILKAYRTIQENKRLEVLDGVGHWHCVEAPDLVAHLISSFVSRTI